MSVHAQDRRFKRTPGTIDPRALGYFSPTMISGLELWLDADQIEGLNDGDPVANWPDMSGNGFDGTQADGARKPTYETNELNGKPVVRFDGSDDLILTGLNCGSVCSLIFVLVPTPWNPRGIFDSAPNQQNVIRNYNVDQWEWWNLNPMFNLTFVAATPVLAEFLHTNVGNRNVEYYRDSALISNNNGVGTTAAAWLNPRLGSINVGVHGYYTGDMAEVIFYTEVISADDRVLLETYLNDKYAIW